MKCIVTFFVLLIFTSCEGLKFIEIQNQTNKKTYFIVETLSKDYLRKTQIDNIDTPKYFEYKTYEISPLSESAIAVAPISPLIFGNKIQPYEIYINKLFITQG